MDMETDLSTQLTALQGARTNVSPQIAMVKKNHESEMAMVQAVEEIAQSAPPPAPPGQGTRVDKTA